MSTIGVDILTLLEDNWAFIVCSSETEGFPDAGPLRDGYRCHTDQATRLIGDTEGL